MKVNCPDCSASTNIPLTFSELVERYKPYPILCWYCNRWYASYHDDNVIKTIKIRREDVMVIP